MSFTAVLDANVFYPVTVRNLCLAFADAGFYRPVWTDEITDEWVRNVSVKIGPEKAKEKSSKIDAHFEGSILAKSAYEPFISALSKTDAKDRHVLAAAIASNADMIVTDNLKDFDPEELDRYGIEANSADAFLANQLDLHTSALNVVDSVIRMILPPKSMAEYIERLNAAGLTEFAATFQGLAAHRDQWQNMQLIQQLQGQSVH